MPPRMDLVQGTLDLLILRTLTLEPQHGWGIARRIGQLTRGTFDVKPGSMFPALKRLEDKGWIVASWGPSDNGRRAKFYALTDAGRRTRAMKPRRGAASWPRSDR